jgi:hypothetical protein
MSVQLHQAGRAQRGLTLKCAPRSLLTALAVLTAALLLISMRANAALFAVTVNVGPPALPVYEQPVIPAPGYLWSPGYWAYGDDGYFWVPGTWVLPPEAGLVWTPGYWGWDGGVYAWNAGYWGPTVGYYGGINYGYGYPGRGFYGGEWRGNQFYYNSSVSNVSTTNITNVYNKTVVNNVTVVNHVSYNGGPGGVTETPTAAEQALMHESHRGPTSAQTEHATSASSNHALLASVNHGKPPIAATPKPGNFAGGGVVAARGAMPLKEAQAPAKAAPASTAAEPVHQPAPVAHNSPPKAPAAQHPVEPSAPPVAHESAPPRPEAEHPAAQPLRMAQAPRPAAQHAPARPAPPAHAEEHAQPHREDGR